jgi:hypothetical protein
MKLGLRKAHRRAIHANALKKIDAPTTAQRMFRVISDTRS